MQEVKNAPRPVADAVTLYIHFIDGNTFIQELPVDDADDAQAFLDWYRRPGRDKVWTWQVPTEANLHALHHSHIIAVDVEGYVEPDGRDSRWYERVIDRLKSRWLFRG